MNDWALYEQIAAARLQLWFTGYTHSLLNGIVAKARRILSNDKSILAVREIERLWTDGSRDWIVAFANARKHSALISLSSIAHYHEVYGRNLGEQRVNLPFVPVLDQVLEAAETRLWDDGYTLSSRIWRLHSNSFNGIRTTLIDGIDQGKTSYEIAGSLEQYLGCGADCPRWTRERLRLTPEEIAKGDMAGLFSGSDCQGQGVAYNSLRLARTELQAAYAEAARQMRLEMPWIQGERLYLNDLHTMTYGCECELESGWPASRIGPVRPVGYLRLPYHPHCMCYVKSVRMTDEEFQKRWEEYQAGIREWPEMDTYLQSFIPIEGDTPSREVGWALPTALLLGLFAIVALWARGSEEEMERSILEQELELEPILTGVL